MSTVLAIASGGNAEVGVALAYPIGVFAQFVLLLDYNLNLLIVHRADKKIADGNINAVNTYHILCVVCMFGCWTLSAFLGTYLGSNFVQGLYNSLPEFIRVGLSVAGGIMPAMGMAMLLRMMDLKKFWFFLAIGYVLTAYLGMNIISIAILSVAVAMAIYTLGNNTEDEEDEEMDAVEDNQVRILTKKDLKSIYHRSYFTGACLNYERYLGLGYCFAILPALKKLYKGDDLQEAVARNTEFYNTHPYMHNIIMGVSIALEEQRSLGAPIEPQSISATKAALMGPTAGFGDSFFKGVIVTITGAFAAALAIEGNPIAPIVFIVPNIIVFVLVRYYGTTMGYKFGTTFILKMKSNNIIQKFVDGSTIVGLMVTAGLITNYVKLKLATVFNFGGKEIILNDLIDSVIPKLLPYCIVFFFYYIIKKYPKNGLYITLALSFAIGILGVLFKIL